MNSKTTVMIIAAGSPNLVEELISCLSPTFDVVVAHDQECAGNILNLDDDIHTFIEEDRRRSVEMVIQKKP